MKTAPVVSARISLDADGIPRAPDFDDLYHPRQGALAQARHVFLAGNDLPRRWRGRRRFVILETGFGLGNNFLAAWQAWQDDAERCGQLHFVSIEAHPPTRDAIARLARDASLRPHAEALAAAWPVLTPNLHALSFDQGRVRLLLAFGDVADWLPQIDARVDAYFLDGFAPARNPSMWEPRLFKAMARMAAPGATVATWSAARSVRDGLVAAGFEASLVPGSGGKREITVARHAPRFTPRPPRGDRGAASIRTLRDAAPDEPVVIVGAGLAGCATAAALADVGLSSIVFERNADVAGAASGNAGGLFHGVVHGDDGRHARFQRAAALAARQAVASAIADGQVGGAADGALRIDPDAADASALQRMADRLGLPTDYARAVTAAEASALAGIALAAPAWYFPGGGWVDPGALCRHFVSMAGAATTVRCSVRLGSMRWSGGQWLLLDAEGVVVAAASTVVLANAGAAFDLLGGPGWPMLRTRGQTSGLETARWPAAASLHLPIAGSGYLLPPIGGRLWFGAASSADDDDPAVRDDSHQANATRLMRLVDAPLPVDLGTLAGRTGFRWSCPDRLPAIGAVPTEAVGGTLGLERPDTASPHSDQPRFAQRAPGLFVLAGLGSRGIAAASLGAQAVAAAIAGAPSPLEADLLDAVDPARFASRAVRRLQSSSAPRD